MPQVLIRDLDSEILKRLKKRAEENHRSLQRELHFILSQAAAPASESGAKRLNKGAHRKGTMNAPTGSVWNSLKRSAAGKLSKEDIDSYIRAARESWESSGRWFSMQT